MNTTPKCKKCNDTGEVEQLGMLDCAHCNVAEDRAALEAWAASLPCSTAERDLLWLVYQRGREAALSDAMKSLDAHQAT